MAIYRIVVKNSLVEELYRAGWGFIQHHAETIVELKMKLMLELKSEEPNWKVRCSLQIAVW